MNARSLAEEPIMRLIDLQDLEEKMSKVTNYCSDEKNFKVPVMKAVEQVLGKSN